VWAALAGACQAGRTQLSAAGERGPELSAYAKHLQRLGSHLPRGMSLVAHPPFVVIGQGSQSRVQRTSERLLGLAVPRLKRDFFERDPETTDVWLLDDAASFNAISQRLFHSDPGTPFGFYVRERNTMVMNLARGGGTLLHELVHPFMAANFPSAPAWFNEGMGSLFEQTDLRDDALVGLLNWRLPGLQRELRAGEFRGLRHLVQLSDEAFYAGSDGDHYAAARYLLYYLQEKRLLQRYYREFRAAAGSDPTGLATLQRVLGEADLEGFEARWSRWVLGL
jgi:hypothetical protein